METVIQAVRGDSLDVSGKPCVFCDRTEGTKLFAIVVGKKFDGVLVRTFPACSEHIDKLNALLSGEFDIDQIELEKYRRPAGRAVRLRG